MLPSSNKVLNSETLSTFDTHIICRAEILSLSNSCARLNSPSIFWVSWICSAAWASMSWLWASMNLSSCFLFWPTNQEEKSNNQSKRKCDAIKQNELIVQSQYFTTSANHLLSNINITIDPLHPRHTRRLCHAHRFGLQLGLRVNAASPNMRTSMNNAQWHCPPIWLIHDYSMMMSGELGQ